VVLGAAAVARQSMHYSQLGLVVRPALVNGAVGAVTTRGGEPFSVGGVIVRGGRIVELDILADPERLRRLDLTVLDG
jgi:RNA polymerase sigma-70 factor (ECF subfamily)